MYADPHSQLAGPPAATRPRGSRVPANVHGESDKAGAFQHMTTHTLAQERPLTARLAPPGRVVPLRAEAETFASTAPAEPRAGAIFAASPPQSIASFVAGIVEPALSVALLFAVTLWQGEPIDRATLLLSMLVLLLTFPGKNLFHQRPLDVLTSVAAAWALTTTILLACGAATRSFKFFDTDVLLWWAALTPVAHYAAALAGGALLRMQAADTHARRTALVVGAGPLGHKVAQMLKGRKAFGHDFVGYLEDREPHRCPEVTHRHLLGRLDDLPRLITERGIKDVYVTLPLSQQPRILRLMGQLQDSAATVYFVPDVFGVNIIQGRMHNMDGVPVVGLLESPFIGVNGLVKRTSDFILAALILLLIAPLLAVIAIGVKATSPGPAIFKQRRHGLDGEEITVYKFRSMTTMDNGPVMQQARKNDPRITPFGAFLRRSSLDELPQFLNVLQGRMSIVGPRPHAVAHNEQYRQLIKSYMVRHKVRPGITGWAQVNGCRGETDTLGKMAKRIEYDLEYLRNWSLLLDLKIIARTAGVTWFDKKAY